jgi:hypothetical protein
VWRQGYTYDRYGNRRIDETTTTTGMVGLNPQINAATNRISSSGYTYDAVGNLTRDELNHTYSYDAENRWVGASRRGIVWAGLKDEKGIGLSHYRVTTQPNQQKIILLRQNKIA